MKNKFFFVTLLLVTHIAITKAAVNPDDLKKSQGKKNENALAVPASEAAPSLFERVSTKYKEWHEYLSNAEPFTPEEKKIFAEMEKELLKGNASLKQ